MSFLQLVCLLFKHSWLNSTCYCMDLKDQHDKRTGLVSRIALVHSLCLADAQR